MSIEQLQAEIIKGQGYILSDGTLNLQHLLPKAYDLMHNLRLEETMPGVKTMLSLILDCFNVTDEDLPYINAHGLFSAQYHGRVMLITEGGMFEVAGELWNEDIYDLFNNIAPEGYSFGSSEGDGACIGWFESEEGFQAFCAEHDND